jgi:tetratricopeptide (TPR) repeat protein
LTLPMPEFPWDRFPQSEAVLVYAHALGAARSGNVDAARKGLARLQALREALITAKLGYWVEQVEIQQQVATAWVALAQGKRDEALQIMRAAADREEATEKHPVTPGPIIPARELLGEMLLAADQPQAALQAFEASMQVEPNRFWGLYGAARAAELSRDRDKAKTYYAQLLALAERADSERPALAQAKAFMGER